MNNWSSRQRAWLIFYFILILIGVIYLVLPGRTVSWGAENSVPGIFSTSASFGPGTLVFSNGRAFVSYNYLDGATRLLSQDTITPSLDNINHLYVSADKNYLVFHTTLIAASSSLYAQALQVGINPSQGSWWVYNIAQQTYHNLPQNITSLHLINQSIYTLSGNSQKTIDVYSLSSLQKQASHAVPNCTDFYPVAGGVVLQTPDSKVLYTNNFTIYNVLFSDSTILNISAGGQFALGIHGSKIGGQLVLFSLQKKNYHVIDNNLGSTVAWTAQNDAAYTKHTSGASTLYFYSGTSNKVASVSFSGTLSQKSVSPVVLLDNQTAILNDTRGNSYIAGKKLALLKSFSNGYSQTITQDGHPLVIAYYPSQGAFILTLDAALAQQEKNAVYAQLSKDGYNPNLLDIRMTLFAPPAVFDLRSF